MILSTATTKRLLLTAFIALFVGTILSPLWAETKESAIAFKPGEVLTYKAFYNWGLLWVYSANVEFKVMQKSYENKPAIFLETKARSIKSYDWFFKVEDFFNAYVSFDGFKPLWAERNTSEGSVKVYETYTFNPGENKIYSFVRKKNKGNQTDTLVSKQSAFDVLTAVYYCRNLNFEGCKPKEKIPIRLLLDGKIVPLFIRYLGKETIPDRLGKRYNCIRFSAMLVAGTAFKGGEDVNVWVTDDQNRVPILVEAKVIIGSVKAYLDSATGLKYPMDALVK